MKVLLVLLIGSIVGANCSAITLGIGKRDAAIDHRCEIQSIEVETRYENQPNRVVIALREPRGGYNTCPASVAIDVDSRDQAMKLYDVIRSSSETTCLISGVVTSKHNNKTCDAGFNVKVKL